MYHDYAEVTPEQLRDMADTLERDGHSADLTLHCESGRVSLSLPGWMTWPPEKED
jgi:hypothetical protein